MDTAEKYTLTGIDSNNAPAIRKMALALAWPAIMEMMLVTLVQYIDTAMVGNLGEVAIAAVGISNSPMMFLMGLFTALGVGATALVARSIGARDELQAHNAAQQSFLLGGSLALVISVLGFLYAEWVPTLMGAAAEVIPQAGLYLRITSVTFFFHFCSMILSGVLRGAGDTKTPMKVNVLANIINVVFNFLLIYPTRTVRVTLPTGGTLLMATIPGAGLGVAGAAAATALARAVAGFFVLYVLIAGKRKVRLSLRMLRFDLTMIRRILKIGLPASLERLSLSGGQMLFSVVVLSLGTVQYAAHHLAIVAESISYMPGFGFSMAATTLTGQGLGAGKPKLAEAYGYITCRLAVAVMGVMGLLFFFGGHLFIRCFTADPEIVRYGARALRLVAFAQIPFAVQIVLAGALRGAGDTVWPLVIGAASMWCIRLVFAWFLVNRMGLGLAGAWFAMVLDLWVRGILTLLRFRSGRWQKVAV
ncbi:MAG: MATE family efflux transporter [Firmicutes bacterium]|jgi:putative MATE family efflux protein|nr:MATE family efflux transporter [Bacillota bacterium]